MGRKVDMKKIEDITKCQVTFSKRRSSLMKKANEIAVCCEVDVAFITFSPSGRVSKYCNKKRIEEVLFRYVNLTTDKRYAHMMNIQEKQEKIRQLDHIKNDTSKLQYLDKQIENLELQNKKCALELQILEADMRDFEPFSEQEPSLHQLMWCEKNLKQSLQRVLNRKNALLSGFPSSSQKQPAAEGNNCGATELNGTQSSNVRAPTENPPIGNGSGQLLMQLDPWISPYSAKVRESIFEDLVEGELPPITFPNQVLAQSDVDFTPNMEIDYQQVPFVNEVSQPLANAIETFDCQFMNFPRDNNIVDIPSIDPNSNLGLNYDNLVNNSMPSSSNVNQAPYAGGNVNLPMFESYTFNSMPSMVTTTSGSTWFNPYKSNETSNYEDFGLNTSNEMVPLHQPHEGRGSKEVMVDNNTVLEEGNIIAREDEKVWNGGIQAASLWEWEDLLTESFNEDDLARLF